MRGGATVAGDDPNARSELKRDLREPVRALRDRWVAKGRRRAGSRLGLGRRGGANAEAEGGLDAGASDTGETQ